MARQNITKGKWYPHYDDPKKKNDTDLRIKVGDDDILILLERYQDISPESHMNAKFVCECANQCQKVNPSNPLAVARNIEKMYKVLIKIHADEIVEQMDIIDEVLADIKKEA